jgi:glycopeptide antibiotics resistance protein
MAWFGKWIFVTFAASFGIYLLLGICLLPLYGYSVINGMTGPSGNLYLIGIALLISPVTFKKLK